MRCLSILLEPVSGLGRMNAEMSRNGVTGPFILGQKAWLRALERTAPIRQHPAKILPMLLNEIADRSPDATALCSADGAISYGQLAAKINRFSRWGLGRGLNRGSVVALFMENCLDYPAIWLGLTQIGGTVALLNTHLSGEALAHCIDVAGAQRIIASENLAPVVKTASQLCRAPLEILVQSVKSDLCGRSEEGAGLTGNPLREGEAEHVTLSDRALCIYTSGTTGLPKAANVSHRRIMTWSFWFAGMMDVRPEDRLYNCLPFYHAVGGVASLGAVLAAGGSVFVRENFCEKLLVRSQRPKLHYISVHR